MIPSLSYHQGQWTIRFGISFFGDICISQEEMHTIASNGHTGAPMSSALIKLAHGPTFLVDSC